MAIVGEARIIVRADTTAIKEQIRRGFAATEQVAADAGSKVSKSFGAGFGKDSKKMVSDFSKEAENLARSFHRAIRNSYKWQAATGALIQSISVLANGLLALIGNIGGAVAAGGALIGLMAQMKVTALVAKQAFSGIMKAVTASNSGSKQSIKELREEMQQLAFAAEEAALGEEAAALKLEKAREELARSQSLPPDNRARREAELAYQQADLAYRKAKDKAADALDEVQNPKKKTGSGTDPFADLTETQKKFAIYLKSVMPKMKELREAAASSFLPTLTEQMKIMFSGGFFDMLVKGFSDVSKGLSSATQAFTNTLFDPKTKSNIGEFFKNTARTTGTMGNVLGKAFSGFFTLMKALDPLIARFTNFLNSKATGFADNMRNNFGPITAFFRNAGEAAAGWGTIIGRIFNKLKELIKANIGPGSGGQLLLDWMKEGTNSFRGLDGAAGDFARKNYFLAAAENMKAVFQSIGQIFSVFQGLAASPDIKMFWETLSGLSEPLEEILHAAMGSSVEFAKLAVAVAEVAAAFADVGQLQAYMTILGEMATFFANFVNLIKPVLQAFGPLVGAIGATVTIMIVFRKITLLTWGTLMILKGGITATIAAFKIYKAVVWAGVIAKEAMRMSTLKNTAAAGLEQAAMFKNMLTMRLSSVAIGGTTLAQTALGRAMLASIPSITAMGASLWAALAPLLPVILAIVAAIALVAAGIAIFNHINTENSKKALKSLNKEFAETKNKALGAAEAQDMWTASLLSVYDSAKTGITDVKYLGQALSESAQGSMQYNALTTSLNTYATSLSKVAKKSLPEAQRQLRNMIFVGGMSRKQVEDNILSNEEYTNALEKQANAMGDTIKNMDGTINKQKALDYATGEGTYLTRKAALEREKLNQILRDSFNSFIDLQGPLQQNIDDLKKYSDTVYDATKSSGFSLKKYVEDIKKQTSDADDWLKRINALGATMSGEMYQNLVAMGKDGMGLVQSLTTIKNGIAVANKEAVDTYVKSQADMIAAQEKAKLYASGITNSAALAAALMNTKKFTQAMGYYSGAVVQDLGAKGDTSGLLALANTYGVTVDEIVAQQKRLTANADLADKVSLTAEWDAGTLDQLREKLLGAVGKITLTATSSSSTGGSKDGGFAGGAAIRKYANGGSVFGPQGPRSDLIPTMLSSGEFVTNAASAYRYRPLLEAINSGSIDRLQNTATISPAAPSNNISMTINAAPGMDEQEIANLVSAKLNFELSRGMTS